MSSTSKAPITTGLASGSGAPYDLQSSGDPRTYADLLTPQGLRGLARTVDGIGPDKDLVVARRADGSLGAPTGLVAAAHAAGLVVTPYTFRAENTFLPTNFRVGTALATPGRVVDLEERFLAAGVDGFFTDQADRGVTAVNAWLVRVSYHKAA